MIILQFDRLMYMFTQLALMNKKNLEIISSVGSVVLLIILFGVAHQLRNSFSQEYGFIGALVVFIALLSVVGLKLNEMQ